MSVKIKLLHCLILLLAFSCKGESHEVPELNVAVQIAPSKEAVVESSGGEISFSISPQPASALLMYAYSVNWISPVTGKQNTWKVEQNTAEVSRSGKIYILNADNYAHLDTISVKQKSVSGQLDDDPQLVFTETEVPIAVPFAGNSYVTTPGQSTFIDNMTGLFSHEWNDKSIVMSTYFRLGGAGELNLAFVGSNASGAGKIRFTVDGQNYDVTVSGPTRKIYAIAKVNRGKAGYLRIDMQGLSRTGASFGEINYFRTGGAASSGTNYFVTEARMNEASTNTYFFRRGSSVHYFYTLPEGNTEYFYNEILVTPENAVNGTYYMMNGFSEGYMGIQQSSEGVRKVLFSVWSPYTTDNPADIPEDKRIKLLRKGANVTIGEFGGEGSGGQSWLNYAWTPGVVYKALVGVKPDGLGSTIYTAYFFADNEWKLIASFSRPQTSTWYKGAYSFLENFDPVQSYIKRQVSFGNQWVRTASGEWKEVTLAGFSCDDTGRTGMRYDIFGKLNTSDNRFVLQSFGFFDEHTDYGTAFRRTPSAGGAPDVDISALEKIPSVQ
ncbi:MAG: DUF3472 domain-containing protein [Mangrovibacterium sp.]